MELEAKLIIYQTLINIYFLKFIFILI